MSSYGDEALKKVTNHIKEAFDILKYETERVHKEMGGSGEAENKPKRVDFSKIVKFNVGGHLFSTTLETLNKAPGSMLHAMFLGEFDTIAKPSEDGSYFIDRDGTHFRYILNYLRTGQLIVPDDEIIRREILAEAEFYQVEGIIDELTRSCLEPFEDSVILSSDKRQTLIDWMTDYSQDLADTKLLYRASRDGWAASNFHSCCDNKGPTVTVVKTGHCVFGGYTEEPWESPEFGGFRRAPDSFLFSLVNPSGLPPTKLPLKVEKEKYAVCMNSNFGPVFGDGHDLNIVDEPNLNSCSLNLNKSYQCPVGQNADTFLTKSPNFTLSEFEVFGFEK